MFLHRIRIILLATIALSVFFIGAAAYAESEIMLLIDASGSMTAPGTPGTSHTKFEEVRSAANVLLQNLPMEVAVGLRIIGGTPSADCYTSILYYSPAQGIRSQLQDQLASVNPAGTRGLYQGIDDSMGDLAAAVAGTDRIIVVITDGGDGCDRDFDPLTRSFSFAYDAPRVVIYGLDLNLDDREILGEFVASTGGRLINLDSIADLSEALVSFSQEFVNNLRIHLQDSSGNAIHGDIIVKDVMSEGIIAEHLDISDFSIMVEPGTYEVIARYLGQELRSETFVIEEGDSRTVTMEFDLYREPFILMLRDMYDQPLRARVTFINSANEPVLTTDADSVHRVELPADTYSIEIRIGDYTHDVAGVQIGPSYEQSLEVELPVALGVLEIEITNMYGSPLNASVVVYDQDGTLMDEAPYTSFLYSSLPPGGYRIVAEFEGTEIEEMVQLYSGEQRQIALEIDVPLGDIFIMLRTESGNDVWGWVKIYNSEGHLLERFDRERVESPDWYATDLPVGIYRIEAEADGIVRVVSGIEAREGEETEVLIEFPDEIY